MLLVLLLLLLLLQKGGQILRYFHIQATMNSCNLYAYTAKHAQATPTLEAAQPRHAQRESCDALRHIQARYSMLTKYVLRFSIFFSIIPILHLEPYSSKKHILDKNRFTALCSRVSRRANRMRHGNSDGSNRLAKKELTWAIKTEGQSQSNTCIATAGHL